MVPGTVSTVSAHVIPNRRKKEKGRRRERKVAVLSHITSPNHFFHFVDISFENKLRR